MSDHSARAVGIEYPARGSVSEPRDYGSDVGFARDITSVPDYRSATALSDTANGMFPHNRCVFRIEVAVVVSRSSCVPFSDAHNLYSASYSVAGKSMYPRKWNKKPLANFVCQRRMSPKANEELKHPTKLESSPTSKP